MDEPVDTYHLPDGETLKIYDDCDPINPRVDWDTFGTMICWHRRYSLGDEHSFEDPGAFDEWWEEQGEHGIRLPVYLYDHSGITMNTTGFSCRWDSGQVGWIYATKDDILNEYLPYEKKTPVLDIIARRPTSAMKERAKLLLVAEVEYYDIYLRGDVYGFVLEDANGDEIDSCWGFYGHDITTNGILDHLSEEQKNSVCEAVGVA